MRLGLGRCQAGTRLLFLVSRQMRTTRDEMRRWAADQKAALVLARTPHGVVMLNRFPYANGHIMVAPRRHTSELAALPTEEYVELSEVLRRAMVLLQEFF